jgi:hypothetical protein
MTRAAHTCGEDFCGRDKGCGVGAEVEEELCEDVEREEVRFCEPAPGETEDAEDDGENKEAADLDGFAAELVDEENGAEVAWESTRADEYNLACGSVAQMEVEVGALVEAHGGEKRGGGKAQAVEGEVEEAVDGELIDAMKTSYFRIIYLQPAHGRSE